MLAVQRSFAGFPSRLEFTKGFPAYAPRFVAGHHGETHQNTMATPENTTTGAENPAAQTPESDAAEINQIGPFRVAVADIDTARRLERERNALYSALSRLATWDGPNGPCFCQACENRFGPARHRHSEECDKARDAMAGATGQRESFIVAGLPWNYSRDHYPMVPAFSGVRRFIG